MFCTHCDVSLPLKARFCPACGTKLKSWEEPKSDEPAARSLDRADAQHKPLPPPPQDSGEVRTRLLDCYLNFSVSRELSEWLQELGLPSSGTMQEKLGRLRRHAGSQVLSAESLSRQIIYYLSQYDEGTLSEICQELGIDSTGPKEILLPRIYREVGLREGRLQPLSEDAQQIITGTFIPLLEAFEHKEDYYLDIWGKLSDELGDVHVPDAYGSAVIAVLIPWFFQEAQMTLLQNELAERIAQRSLPRTMPDVEPLSGLS